MKPLTIAGSLFVLVLVSALAFQQTTSSRSPSNNQQPTGTASAPTVDNGREITTDQKQQKAEPQVSKNGSVALDLGSVACPPRGDTSCREKEAHPNKKDKPQQDH